MKRNMYKFDEKKMRMSTHVSIRNVRPKNTEHTPKLAVQKIKKKSHAFEYSDYDGSVLYANRVEN